MISLCCLLADQDLYVSNSTSFVIKLYIKLRKRQIHVVTYIILLFLFYLRNGVTTKYIGFIINSTIIYLKSICKVIKRAVVHTIMYLGNIHRENKPCSNKKISS